MSGNKHRREHLNPGLLPFMAVLLCTMGALVLILILMVSNTQASVRKKVEEHKVKVAETIEDVEFYSREIAAGRKKQQEEIAKQREHLAHYEDHIGRLNEELSALQRSIDQISKGELGASSSSAKVRTELLRDQIAEAEKKLEEEKKRIANAKPAFAIFPYKGPNGTNRRPIYLECTAEGIRIQPEGVLIGLNGLRPPFGPGNPLDASLRLIRNEYQKGSNSTSVAASPYPLLLVRPDGIKTYSLARAAMGGWDDQFGYELVDASMPLAFPPSTPGLNEILERTIAAATQRQEALAAAMPSRYRDSSNWNDFNPEKDGADANHELEREEGAIAVRVIPEGEKWEVIQEIPVGAQMREGNIAANRSGLPNTVSRSPNGATGNDTNSGSPSGLNSPQGMAMGGLNSFAAPQMPMGNDWTLGGGNEKGPSDPPSLNGYGHSGSNGHSSNTMSSGGSGSSGSDSYASGEASSSNTVGSAGTGNANAGDAGMGANGPGGGAGANASQGSSMQPIFLSSETENQFGKDPTSNGTPPNNVSLGYRTPSSNESGASGPSQDSSGKGTSNDRSAKAASKGRDGGDKPISVSHGRGWAQSRALGKATPVQREIRMIVLADRWLLVSDVNPGQIEATIFLAEGPSAASAQLAKLIRERIASWGVAVSGGYWKAKLVAETYSDADLSRQRLEKLLEGSGLEIAVKNLDASQRR